VILQHTPRKSAQAVKKAILSAKANADYNHGYKPDSLFIKSITVTPGLRYRRYQPAAHGRALPYQLKSSHIRVTLDGEQRPAKSPIKAESKNE
jgi:large subunit ribosomal protein L22